ncbi:MAG: gamma-butyrobetaine hydroxylase-like domain-containing protein [Nevskiaceae bacterium]
MKVPTSIKLHRKSRVLDVEYADGTRYALACEYLRVFSPSAEVRGHTGGEPTVVPGKRNVAVERVEPVGSYAVRLVFDDGHSTGLYSWDVLEDLGAHQAQYWARYLERLAEHGLTRDSAVTKLSALPPAPKKWKPGG